MYQTHTLHPSPAVDRRLLWRELWLGASGAADWWVRQRCFASSAAAMSVVSLLPRCLPLLPGVPASLSVGGQGCRLGKAKTISIT